MAYLYTDLDPIDERSSGEYECDLADQAGDPVTPARLTTLTLTLVDRTTLTIINLRDGQNVLNANNVTLDVNGHLVWSFRPADTAIIGTGNPAVQEHVAIFSAKGDGGALERNWAVLMKINNIITVPHA